MRKIFFTAALAIGSFVAVNAQVANTQQNCCSRESDVNLDIDIASILCLYPECDQYGYVDFDCRDDFNAPRNFKEANGTTDFEFGVWSNRRFKVSTKAASNTFNRTGPVYPGTYYSFPVNNVGWRIQPGSVASFFGTGPILPSSYSVGAKILGGPASDPTGDNTFNDAVNGVHSFSLNFWTLPASAWAHHPTQYMPGDYDVRVDITASID